MPWGDIAFDVELAANVVGNLAGAPTLDTGDVKLRKPALGHVAMIAAHHRGGYADASRAVCWTLSNASAAVIQPSTRRGRWLSLAATELRWVLVRMARSAVLCKYWRTNGLLRHYFPKGTDLAKHSADDLEAVVAALNGRPQTLGWKTSAEALNDHLLSIQAGGVATTP
jgi:hypothetical protein